MEVMHELHPHLSEPPKLLQNLPSYSLLSDTTATGRTFTQSAIQKADGLQIIYHSFHPVHTYRAYDINDYKLYFQGSANTTAITITHLLENKIVFSFSRYPPHIKSCICPTNVSNQDTASFCLQRNHVLLTHQRNPIL